MKKIFMIVLVLFIFTGCDATYNLEINNDSIYESSVFLLDKTDENEKILDDYYGTNYLAFYDMDSLKDNMYKKERIDDGNHIGMNLSYTYYGDNYQNSSLLDRCYYKKSLIRNDNYIILYTEEGLSCFYKDESKLLDSLTVNIKTDLQVEENNADSVKGNVYTWKFTEEDFFQKNIFIKIKKSKKINFVPLIVIFVILVIVLTLLIRVRTINKKNNKI